MQARLISAHIESVLSVVSRIRLGQAVSVKVSKAVGTHGSRVQCDTPVHETLAVVVQDEGFFFFGDGVNLEA